ncbi:MBL fold metallo-hydrolase [Streptomyces sp. NPDC091412]|uniref:MBL fold metallo-hydrolase n=1 Tax=Streptomyces sp. NPDC091412 TaxID=3366002 RepID=UPI00382BF906
MTDTTSAQRGMDLITLGVAAGPAIRGPEHGIASAVVVDDAFYLVDFGIGCTRAANEAGLRGHRFRAGFITHLHSDHVIELPGFLLWNWGRPVNGFSTPVHIVGPGPDPEDGTRHLAGTDRLVASALDAFSYDIAIRVGDEDRPPLADLVRASEVAAPARGSAAAGEPFEVYADERITVTAVLVDHPPVHPALAYRIDSAYGSVTFSGDTAESANLARLAEGTDVLVHEAVNLDFYRSRGFSPAFLAHQENSHTPPAGAGRVAKAAGARRLVLSHFAGPADAEYWRTEAASTYDGPIDVATSGARFSVATGPVVRAGS